MKYDCTIEITGSGARLTVYDKADIIVYDCNTKTKTPQFESYINRQKNSGFSFDVVA